MTAFLIALAALAGSMAALNLLLTVGVIRRLRLHSEQLTSLSALSGQVPEVVLGPGSQAGDFAATTTDGEPVSRDLLSGQTLVGVLTAGCGACQERLPDFVAQAQAYPGGRGQVLAVLAGEPDQLESYREQLAPVARVVIEPPFDGPIVQALGVQGFPVFAVLDADGVVVASGLSPDKLPVPASAA